MGSVVTYQNDGRSCYCQIKFESGERILISIAGQPHPSIKVIRLILGGLLPRNTIWELDATQAGGPEAMARKTMEMFLEPGGKLTHPLDAIRDALLPSRSIQEALKVLSERESRGATS